MRKFIALIVVLCLLVCLPLALVMFNTGRVLFDAPLVKRVVTREVTESDLVPAVLRWLTYRRAQERVMTGEAKTAIDEPDVLKALEFPTIENWRVIKMVVMPNQFLETWTATTLDGLYTWVDNNDPLPQITLDFKPWKDYNRSPHADKAIQIVYDSLPPCQQPDIDDFLKRLAAAPPGKEVLYNLYTPCMFPMPWKPDQNQDYLSERERIIAAAPDRFFLTQELSRVQKETGVGAETLKGQIRLIRTAANLSIVVPIGLLLLLFLLTFRSPLAVTRWIGLPLLVGGLLTLLPALAYQPLVNAILIAGPMSEVPNEVRTEFLRAFGVLLAEIFRPMLYQSLALILFGLLFTFGGLIRRPRRAAALKPADLPPPE